MLTEVLISPGCLQLKGSRQSESKSATGTLMLPVFKSLSLVSTPSKTNRMKKKKKKACAVCYHLNSSPGSNFKPHLLY